MSESVNPCFDFFQKPLERAAEERAQTPPRSRFLETQLLEKNKKTAEFYLSAVFEKFTFLVRLLPESL